MGRRRFLLTSPGGVIVAPLDAEAQPPGKVYRMGRRSDGEGGRHEDH